MPHPSSIHAHLSDSPQPPLVPGGIHSDDIPRGEVALTGPGSGSGHYNKELWVPVAEHGLEGVGAPMDSLPRVDQSTWPGEGSGLWGLKAALDLRHTSEAKTTGLAKELDGDRDWDKSQILIRDDAPNTVST